MDVIIKPAKLRGSVKAVSSKSFAHRQIVASLLSDKKTEIIINGFSNDIMRTLSCVKALGGEYEIEDNKATIYPPEAFKKSADIQCGESGTTARIILPVCAALCEKALISGEGRLPERPFIEMTEVLRKKGCEVSSDKLPICISGELESGEFSIRGDVSSQYITGLMMALPNLNSPSKIVLTTPIKSKPYINITTSVLESFGILIEEFEGGYLVPVGKYITPEKIVCEGDWSNAAFWIVANSLGADIELQNLNYDSVQGDRRIMNILDSIEIDVDETPDLFPILAVLAAGREGTTVLSNAGRLRLKESDRIESVFNMLRSLGCDVQKGNDYLEIRGKGELKGGAVDGCNDHRIVMAASIAATICQDTVTIKGAEAVNKSYPSFFEEYRRLGGDINVI